MGLLICKYEHIWVLMRRSQRKVPDTQVTVKEACGPLVSSVFSILTSVIKKPKLRD